ncbi:MAG TPA: hypothetical protein VII40_14765 [Xanthobacteraceae bacterium]|jgi:hypothetical protein
MSMTVAPISISEQISISAQLGFAQQPGAVATSQDVATELALWQSTFDSNVVGAIDNTFSASLLNQSATTTDTIIDPATQSLMFEMLSMLNSNVVSEASVGTQLQLQELAQLIATEAQATIDIQA